MINTGRLLAVIVCIQCHNLVYCVSDLSGKEFVLAFPTFATTDRQVHFFIYTLEVLKTIEVNLFTKWANIYALEINTTFELNREEMKHYISEEKFTLLTEKEVSLEFGKGFLRFATPSADMGEKYTYVLTSEDLFYVSVLIVDMSNGRIDMAALQAVPTRGWGTSYIAVTMSYHPSIQIVTSVENKVTVIIKSPRKKFFGKYNAMYYSDMGFMSINLEEHQGFSLQVCPFYPINYGELTGTVIDATNPIGVISGNCVGRDVGSPCDIDGTDSKADMVMEMLLPDETFGTFYVLYSPLNGDNYGDVIVVAAQRVTLVEHKYGSLITEKTIVERGQSLSFTGFSYAHFVQSTKPVGVYLTINKGCGADEGNSAMTLVVPVGLFMDLYIWRTIETKQMQQMSLKHYISYTCLKDDGDSGLVLDNIKLTEYNHTASFAYYHQMWQAGILEIRPGMHEFFSKKSAKFGVYVFGIAKSVTYIYPAGFISAPINGPTPCVPSESKRPPHGNLIDDDCDGYVDEERWDNYDEDDDGKKDEDLMPLAPKNGSWSQWNPWWCVNCFSSNKTRSRQCNDPLPIRGGHHCPGPRVQVLPTGCQDICKQVHGAWGDWNMWTCSNQCNLTMRIRKCDNPPPKFNGSYCYGASAEYQGRNCPINCPTVSVPLTTTTKGRTTTAVRTTSYTTSTSPRKSSSTEKLTTSGRRTTTAKLTTSGRLTTTSGRWTTTSGRVTTSGRFTTSGNVTTSERLTVSPRLTTSENRTTTSGKFTTSGRLTSTEKFTTTRNLTTFGKNSTLENVTANSIPLTTTARRLKTDLPEMFTFSTTKKLVGNITPTVTSLQTPVPTVTSVQTTVPTALVVSTSLTESYSTIGFSEAPPRDGMWSEWTNWTCPQNCHEKKMQRYRLCDNPSPDPGGLECLGPPFQLTEDELCNSVCPDDCPDGRWGLNCTNACPHCENPCDKNTGACTSCKPGWRLPSKSCFMECDKYFYGFDCRGSCIRDCEGRDCLEKVLGTCPEKRGPNYWYLLLLLLLIPMAILCYLPQKYKRRYMSDEDSDVNAEDAALLISKHSSADDQMTTPI